MTNKAKKKQLTGDEMRDTPTGMLKHKALDSHYVTAYLENPKLCQLDVLKLAMINSECTGTATRQRAYEIHDRNREVINTEMVKLASDLKNLSISVIKELMVNADSESVRLSAAQTGTKDLFPNVSIRKETTASDIDESIKGHMQEIAAAEGKTVEQVMKEYLH